MRLEAVREVAILYSGKKWGKNLTSEKDCVLLYREPERQNEQQYQFGLPTTHQELSR
jgi:hypothetical protein